MNENLFTKYSINIAPQHWGTMHGNAAKKKWGWVCGKKKEKGKKEREVKAANLKFHGIDGITHFTVHFMMPQKYYFLSILNSNNEDIASF